MQAMEHQDHQHKSHLALVPQDLEKPLFCTYIFLDLIKSMFF